MWSDLRFRLRALFRREALEGELDDELQFHLDQQIEKGVRAGLSRDEAARRARLAFGTLDHAREECRDARGTRLLDHARQDLVYALRILRRSPAFASLAVASLAAGIGAATAVFVVLHTVVMQSLPVPDPDRLVVLQARRHGERFVLFNPVFEAIQRDQRVLSGMAAVSDDPFLPVALDSTEPLAYMPTSRVSGSYFDVLGVSASPGRTLTDADDVPGGPCTAVISHGLWVRRFGQRPSVVGAHLRVRDTVCTVVGVAPPEFRSHQGGYAPDLWLPLRAMTSRELLQNHHLAFFSGVIGRLRDGVDRTAAERVLTARYRQVLAGEPEGELPPGVRPARPSDYTLALLPGAQGLGVVRNEFGPSLWIVFGVAVVFLLIAAINVGTLLLARGTARTTELATRAALGAGRSRLIRQLATEGAVLAIIGGTLGIVLAWNRSKWILALPFLPLALYLVAPSAVRWRAANFLDPGYYSNAERIQMLDVGWRMLRDHPLTGVGPGRVEELYRSYLKPDDPVPAYYGHLHNNVIQIAAQFGLPVSLAALLFVLCAFRDLLRARNNATNPDRQFLANTAVLAFIGYLFAGLFEYTYGHSLGLIMIAFAVVPALLLPGRPALR